jgi:hypothetical protein
VIADRHQSANSGSRRQQKTHQLVNTSSNSSGSGELQNLKFVSASAMRGF